MGRAASSVQRRRLVLACVIVAAVLALPIADWAHDRWTGSGGVAAGAPGLDVPVENDPYSVLENAQAQADATLGSPPETFADEVGLLEGAYDLRVSQDGDVIGYTVVGDVSAVADAVREHLCEKGWTFVPLGGVEGGTYLKEEGGLRWILVTTTQVGEVTCVVVRCPS